MRKRIKGRPRKAGPRHRNGHLKRTTASLAESPRERAASMPHRKGLGDNAADPHAETELGRMLLRGLITEPQETAGEVYCRMWRGYISTLNAPRTPGEGQGRVGSCSGCSDPSSRKYCACDLRRRIWNEALRTLVEIGVGVVPVVHAVVILDRPTTSLPLLRLGLSGLAEHYGLTNQRKRTYQKQRSTKHVAPVTS